jgi:DNA-binding GntR family transcriptional regulator
MPTDLSPTELTLAGLAQVEPRILSDEAAERLRTAIRSGTLTPGERLVERDLAERLGMSRVPIREAIQRLVEEGLVQKLPHRGAMVYTPTRAEIEEISSLRVVLERFVVERVIERWQLGHESQLQVIVEAMHRAGEQRDLQQVYALDYKFHLTLWEIADHSMVLEVLSSLRTRISRFLYEANNALTTVQLEEHSNTHDGLIDALKNRDIGRAQHAFTQHVLAAKTRILDHCKLS